MTEIITNVEQILLNNKNGSIGIYNNYKGCNCGKLQTAKDISKFLRKCLKENYKDYKFSVTSQYNKIDIILKDAKINLFSDFEDLSEESQHKIIRKIFTTFNLKSATMDDLKKYYSKISKSYFLSEKVKKDFEDIDILVNSFNYDNSSVEIDYFDSKFYYFGVNIDNFY